MAEMFQRHVKIAQRIDIHDQNLQISKEKKSRHVFSTESLRSVPFKSSTSTTEEAETTDYTLVYDESTKPDAMKATHANSLALSTTKPVVLNVAKDKVNEQIEKVRKEVSDVAPFLKVTNVEIFNPLEKDKDVLTDQVQKLYKQRKARLNKFCGPRKGWMWLDSMQMFAVPEKDIVICTVQKAGSTSWHRLLHEMNFPEEKWNGDKRRHWKYAAELSDNVKERLIHSKKVTRIITVRHPFARIVSVWNTKFHKSIVGQHGNKMMLAMPGVNEYIGRHPVDPEHTIAFEDFAQYIADVGLDIVDGQLKSIDDLCSPCVFPYDYVVKSETAPEDSWFVTDRINATLPSFPRHVPTLELPLPTIDARAAKLRRDEEARVLSRLFRKVPRATTRVLMKLYADDFRAFGYTFDISTLEAGGFL